MVALVRTCLKVKPSPAGSRLLDKTIGTDATAGSRLLDKTISTDTAAGSRLLDKTVGTEAVAGSRLLDKTIGTEAVAGSRLLDKTIGTDPAAGSRTASSVTTLLSASQFTPLQVGEAWGAGSVAEETAAGSGSQAAAGETEKTTAAKVVTKAIFFMTELQKLLYRSLGKILYYDLGKVRHTPAQSRKREGAVECGISPGFARRAECKAICCRLKRSMHRIVLPGCWCDGIMR
jgi:hypothetical protein